MQAPAAPTQAPAAASAPDSALAIIGLAGYLPGCRSVREFWAHLDQDRSLIEEVPASRFDIDAVYSAHDAPGKSRSRWGGFIPSIEHFDACAFDILPHEASLMDPQQRLLLMAVYHTFEDAGYAPASFRNSRTGVFVGFERNEHLLNLIEQGIDSGVGLSQSDSMLANQVSYAFDLRGPSEIVNTMCSSGAVALHRAAQALRAGDIDTAVVGATNLILRPDTMVKLSQTGQMSPVSTVKSFGADAAGYLRGEGVCSVLLKPLAKARADGDAIYAVIRNSAINFNGRGGTSIAAPDVAAHAALIEQCYREAGIDPLQVGYIEAQGMGNVVSDIAEWDAFNRALGTLARARGEVADGGACRIGTLKPMTGHMHAASALGALFKIVRSLNTRTIHKIIGFERAHPSLDTGALPCRLAADTEPWPAGGGPRLAGLHSFGAGGNNAHLLIEEYSQAAPGAAPQAPVVVPVSARSPALLRETLAALAAEVEAHPEYSIDAIAYTLQSGRDALEHRVAFVAAERDEWLADVRAFLAGSQPETAAADAQRAACQALARAWVDGAQADWPARPANGPVRLHLPGSPFDTAALPLPQPKPRSAGTVARRAVPPGRIAEATAETAVRAVLGEFMHVVPGEVRLDVSFSELGFDSLMVTNLCAALHERHRITVAPAVLFGCASPARLVAWLCGARDDDAAAPVLPAGQGEPIAIIGLAGTYPHAPDLDEFWRNLEGGKSCIGEIPASRWSLDDHFEADKDAALRAGKSFGKWGGFIDSVNEFDPLFFHLSPAEARYMHPKERLFMQCAWHTIEDAGYTPAALGDERVGVFVGVSKAGFDNYKDSFFSIANRVSYRFDFNGPSMPLDTACSSSLSAIHEACLHLQAGECSVALAGAVNAYTHPSTFAEFSRLNVLSPSGRCSAFGADADGFVPGEGVGAVLLKPLQRALADGDRIIGIVRGSAINHGGKVNGYTVPSPAAHSDLIRLAMERAGVAAADISYVEAHGTGTPLGDPIELHGLDDAFGSGDGAACRIGSVKTNIGHLEAAAGIAGLTKVLLQMRHQRLVPSLHAARPNPQAQMSGTRFTLQLEAEPWEPRDAHGQPMPRVAGISSFGAGGSNAHVIVQEWPREAAADGPSDAREVLFVLSARDEAALRRYAQAFVGFLARHEDVCLADLAYTLQVGREPMAHRLACVADSGAVLADLLRRYLDGEKPRELVSGRAGTASPLSSAFGADPQAQRLLGTWFEQGKLYYLAELWVGGQNLDWQALHGTRRPRRIGLPAYPFEREFVHPAEMLAPSGSLSRPDKAPGVAGAANTGGARTMLTLLPEWKLAPASASAGRAAFARSSVLLCGVSGATPRAGWRVAAAPADDRLGFEACVIQALEEVQALLASDRQAPLLLQVLVPNDGAARLLAGLGGLLRSARLENPRLSAQLIEVPAQADAGQLAAMVDECRAHPEQAWVRYAGGQRWCHGWTEDSGARATAAAPWKDGAAYLITGGAGGLGFLIARDIAMRTAGATLFLTGRAPEAEKAQALEALRACGVKVLYHQADVSSPEQVEALAAAVHAEAGELTGIVHCAGIIRDALIVDKSGEQVKAVLAPKVSGVQLLDKAFGASRLAFFVLFSSAAGAMGNAGQADYAAANAYFDLFAWQRNIEVAAGRRHGRTLSLDWGLWQEGGMRLAPPLLALLRDQVGMEPIATEAGLQALYQAVAAGHEQVVLIGGEFEKLRAVLLREPGHTNAAPAPRADAGADTVDEQIAAIVAGLLGVQRHEIDSGADCAELGLDRLSSHALAEAVSARFGFAIDAADVRAMPNLAALARAVRVQGAAADATDLRAVALGQLKAALSETAQLAVHRIDEDAALEAYGIDSLMAMQMTARLEKVFGPLSKTLFFEYQTLSALADHFVGTAPDTLLRVAGNARQPAVAAVAAIAAVPAVQAVPQIAPPASPAPEEAFEVAIVGLAGRYPGANSIEEFWEVLAGGRDCITEVPSERWDHSLYFDADKQKAGKTYTKWGGFMDGVDEFDAAFFNISPREAEAIEPQERLFLQSAYEAIADAGYTRQLLAEQSVVESVPGSVGVFVGVTYEEYQLYAAEQTLQGRPTVLSMSPASIANRVSFFCNFHGPSIALDTMCASSLTTIHLACQSLRAGECRAALAGGVNVSIHPAKYLMLGQGKFASTKGRCESFGSGGDGYVPSEGVGVVLLKRLDDALSDGDHIYGVVRGSAINHGGKTNGYAVPNPQAQAEVVRRAMLRAHVTPDAISYVEAHGTGTALGDPIEIAGLTRAYRAATDATGYCAIGSVKSNIGHCEAAAGIAGLTKVLLQLRHGMLVPSLHAATLNPNIDFAGSPFFVQQRYGEWRRPRCTATGAEGRRIAGVSSFGAGGANAHLVIAEAPAPAAAGRTGHPLLVVLSARSETQLLAQARRLLGTLRTRSYTDQQLEQVAYTLQVGREAFAVRLGVLASSQDELEQRLAAFCDGGGVVPGIFKGLLPDDEQPLRIDREQADAQLRDCLARGDYAALLTHWTGGFTVDWTLLYGSHPPRRISLPGYVFERKRYWQPPRYAVAKPAELVPPQAAMEVPVPREVRRAPAVALAALTPPVAVAAGERQAARQTAVALAPLSDVGAAMPAQQPKVGAAAAPPVSGNAAATDGAGVEAELVRELARSLGAVLYLEPSEIPAGRAFTELGLDSVIGVEWIREINSRHAVKLTANVLYECSTLRALAARIAQDVAEQARAPRPAASQAPAAEAPAAQAPEAPMLRDELVRMLAEVLYMAPEEIAPRARFLDLGLDSVVAIEWMRALNQRFGTRIQVDAVYAYPTVDAFAAFVAGQLALPAVGGAAPAPRATAAAVPQPAPEQAPALEALQRTLRNSLASVLYMNGQDIGFHKRFLDLGLDSVLGVEWIRSLNQQFGTSIEVAVLYECPSVAELTNWLMARWPERFASDASPWEGRVAA